MAPSHLWPLDTIGASHGDIEAAGIKSKRMSAIIGLDASVGNTAIIGGSIGLVNNHVNERRFGDDVDADGYQVGLYGVYDPGAFYVNGVTTYSWFDGDSKRAIDFTPFGGTFAGESPVTGRPCGR